MSLTCLSQKRGPVHSAPCRAHPSAAEFVNPPRRPVRVPGTFHKPPALPSICLGPRTTGPDHGRRWHRKYSWPELSHTTLLPFPDWPGDSYDHPAWKAIHSPLLQGFAASVPSLRGLFPAALDSCRTVRRSSDRARGKLQQAETYPLDRLDVDLPSAAHGPLPSGSAGCQCRLGCCTGLLFLQLLHMEGLR